jgi:hypothetical protein
MSSSGIGQKPDRFFAVRLLFFAGAVLASSARPSAAGMPSPSPSGSGDRTDPRAAHDEGANEGSANEERVRLGRRSATANCAGLGHGMRLAGVRGAARVPRWSEPSTSVLVRQWILRQRPNDFVAPEHRGATASRREKGPGQEPSPFQQPSYSTSRGGCCCRRRGWQQGQEPPAAVPPPHP